MSGVIYAIRTTKERKLHFTFSQILSESVFLIDIEHNLNNIFVLQLEQIKGDVVLLEDDLILCKNFCQRIENIISLYKNFLINFFTYPMDYCYPGVSKSKKGFAYNQCTYYPYDILQRIIKVLKGREDYGNFPKDFTPEKQIQWAIHQLKIPFYIYRPALIQHIDNGSLLWNKKSLCRRTPFFVDYLEDLQIPYEQAYLFKNREALIGYMKKQFEDNDNYKDLLPEKTQK